MVVHPDFTRFSRSGRALLAAHAVPLLTRFVGNLLITIALAAVIGVALGSVAGFLFVVALW